jgi:hypothetical protein
VLEFMVSLLVLGMGSFAWLYRKGIQPVASFVGAVTVVFASTVTLRVLAGQCSVLETFAWWPWLLCAIDSLERRFSLGWLLTGIIALAFMMLAGHPPTVLQAGLATSVYVVLSLWRCERRIVWLASLALIAFVAPLLAAVQLFEGLGTAAEGLRRAGMPYSFSVSHSFPPEQLLTLLSPDLFGNADRFNLTYFGRVFYWDATFFVGIGGLLLAVHGAFGKRRAEQRRALGLAVFLVIVAMGGYTPLYRLLYEGLPGFEFARAPSKFLFFASVFTAWLVALGAERLWSTRDGVVRTACVGAAVAVIAAALAIWTSLGAVSLTEGAGPMATFMSLARSADFVVEGVAEDWQPRLLRGVIVAAVTAALLAAAFAAARWRREAVYVVLLLAVIELTAFGRIGRGTTRMTIELGLRPEIVQTYRISGTTRVQETAAPSNVAMAQRNYAIYGYDPVMLGRYLEFLYWTQGEDWRELRKPTRFVPYAYHPMLALLRTRYRVDWKTKQREDHPGAWPHFAFVDRYRVAERGDVLDVMSEPGFDPRRTVVLEQEPVPAPVPAQDRVARPHVTVRSESTDHIELEVDLDRPQILLVTDAYSEGWRAVAVGAGAAAQPAYEVLPGDYVLRAVPLAAGHHRLRLEYAPRAHRVGAALSAVSGVVLAGVGLVWGAVRFRRRGPRWPRTRQPENAVPAK